MDIPTKPSLSEHPIVFMFLSPPPTPPKVTAYCPLANGRFGLLEHPNLCALASRHRVSVGELVLSWLVARGIVVIPKS